MEKINDSRSASSLRDRQTGLDPDPSGADSSTVSGHMPLSWSLTLLLAEESLHLKLSMLILVKVVNRVLGGLEKSGHKKEIG